MRHATTVQYSGNSDKGPSEKRTASLERTVHNVPKLSFPIAIIERAHCQLRFPIYVYIICSRSSRFVYPFSPYTQET